MQTLWSKFALNRNIISALAIFIVGASVITIAGKYKPPTGVVLTREVVISEENVNAKPKVAPFAVAGAESFRECLLNGDGNFWTDTLAIVDGCTKKCLTKPSTESMHFFSVGRYDEKKAFLKASNPASLTKSECLLLTIGVGGDIKAEEEFAAAYPGCSLFGMDPKKDQGELYNKVGTYLPYGLSVTGGDLKMTVRVPSGSYVQETVPTLKFKDLVDKYLHKWVIYFATLDIEGPEHFMVPEFEKNGNFSQEGTVICQMDVEFHGPLEKFLPKKEQKFDQFLRKFIARSDYLPIYAVKHIGDVHRKMTVVNPFNKECANVFDMESLFRKECLKS